MRIGLVTIHKLGAPVQTVYHLQLHVHLLVRPETGA